MSHTQLELMGEAPPEDRRVGYRCQERLSELGACNRLSGHGDLWHYTFADGQWWRWREAAKGENLRMTVILRDPQSGHLVHVHTAQLPQSCHRCGAEMQGTLVVNSEGDRQGWTCHGHLEARLMRASLSVEFEARYTLAESMRPGDLVEVTEELLSAVRPA